MRDVQSLFWLRWRQFKDTAVYWLRVLGYRPQDASLSQNLYVLYLVLIGMFWLYTVAAFIHDTASGIGKLLFSNTKPDDEFRRVMEENREEDPAPGT